MYRRLLPSTRYTLSNRIPSTCFRQSVLRHPRLFSTHHASTLRSQQQQQQQHEDNVSGAADGKEETQQQKQKQKQHPLKSLPPPPSSSSSSPSSLPPPPPSSWLTSAVKSAIVTPLSAVGRAASIAGSVALSVAVMGGIYIFRHRVVKAMFVAEQREHQMRMEHRSDPSFIVYQAMKVMEHSKAFELIVNSPEQCEPEVHNMELSSSTATTEDGGEEHSTMVTAVLPLVCHYEEGKSRAKFMGAEVVTDLKRTSRTYRMSATASYSDEEYDLRTLELHSTADDSCVLSLSEEEVREAWGKFAALMEDVRQQREKVQPVEAGQSSSSNNVWWRKPFSRDKRGQKGGGTSESSGGGGSGGVPIVEEAEFKEK